MDKIVKNRFWILLALVPPLVVFGYYKANGAIKAATASRISALDSALSAVPDGKGPNPTWVKAADGGIELYNEALAKAVNVEKVRVWTDQLPRMTWPAEMEPYIPRTPQGDMIYRGQFSSDAGYTYRSEYNPDLLEALYQSIEPLKQEKDGGVSGKVQISRNIIPKHTFSNMLIASDAIWDAQEDLWLLQLLFDAVRSTNRPAENAAKSAVRRINAIRLMGGDGNSTVRSMAGGGAMGGRGGFGQGGDEDDPGNMMPNASAMMNRGGAMGAGRGANVSFDPSEEFGVGFEGMGGGGGALGAGDEAFPSAGGGGGRMRDVDGDMSGAMGAAGGMGRKEIRYLKSTDNPLFQERAFYMSVLIDQKKIADFLVELSNADWPIRIVRFNVGPNGGTTGGYSAPGYMGGAMGGGGRMEDDDDLGAMLGGGGGRGALGGEGMFGALGGGGFGGATGAAGGFSEDLFTSPLGGGNGDEDDPRGLGVGASSAYGPSPLVRGDQIQSLFTHPDLVQLDVCGVITMYKPPEPALYAAVTGKTAPDPAAAAAAPAADTAATPAGDPAAAAPADAGAVVPAEAGADPAAAAGSDAGVSPDSATTPDGTPVPDASTPATGDAAAPAEATDAPAEPPAAEAPAETTTPAPGA